MIDFWVPERFDMADVAGAIPHVDDAARLAKKAVIGVHLRSEGRQVGAMVIGTAEDGFGRDLVVYAAQGKGGGLLHPMHEYVQAVAGAAGLDGVRCITRRPGLVRGLERLGWGEAARMMRVAV